MDPQVGTDGDEDADASDNVLVVRRSVLSRDKKVIGYEYYQPDAAETDPENPDGAASFLKFVESVIASDLLGTRRTYATVSADLVYNPILEQLASAGVSVLVRIDPGAPDLDRLLERMQTLHQAGMRLGLADARIALARPEFGHLASMGFLPVDQLIPPDLLQSTRQLSVLHPQLPLYASGVNSFEEFEVCRRLRMQGFTGPFVTHRRDWRNNTIDPGTLRLVALVNSLRADEEMETIIDDIKRDPLLSYRILCYANSAAIGAQHKVLALKDAILLIGREPLFRWLVVLLCASSPSHSENSALLENALVRGRMMELLAGTVSSAPPEDLFLTGVLSLLDVMLQIPAPALVQALDLPEAVNAALLEHTGPYARLLQLVEACEQVGTGSIKGLCAELGIGTVALRNAQTEALLWARGQQPEPAAPTPTPPVSDTTDSITAAAEQGDATAQWNLASMLAHGTNGIDQDAPRAAQWYQKAADQGFAPAQATLGAMYSTGQGVPQDLGKAAVLLQQAATQGDVEAQYNLALLHQQGLSGEPKLDEAFAWFSKAAEQGLAAAQERLGLMYAVGQPVAQDLVEAYKWFFLASEGKLGTARTNLDNCLTLMDAQQIEDAKARVSQWVQDSGAGQKNRDGS